MNSIILLRVGIFAALMSMANSSSAALLLGTVNNLDPPGAFVIIDTETNAVTEIGQFQSNVVTGLSYDPVSDTLYGIDRDADTLVTVNTSTGAITTVGLLGIDTGSGGMAIDVNTNTLYYTDNRTDILYTIDSLTGVATPIGPHGAGDDTQGLAFDPNTNTLYATGGKTIAIGGIWNNGLYTLDITTGSASLVGYLGIHPKNHGLAFDPINNSLFMAESFGLQPLWAIDTSSGVATSIGNLGVNVGGLTYYGPIPEPASATMLAVAGLAVLRRR